MRILPSQQFNAAQEEEKQEGHLNMWVQYEPCVPHILTDRFTSYHLANVCHNPPFKPTLTAILTHYHLVSKQFPINTISRCGVRLSFIGMFVSVLLKNVNAIFFLILVSTTY